MAAGGHRNTPDQHDNPCIQCQYAGAWCATLLLELETCACSVDGPSLLGVVSTA